MHYQPISDRGRRGAARLVVLMAILAALLAILVLGIPLWHYFMDRSDAYSCGSALFTANDQLRIYVLSTNSDPTPEECKDEVNRAMDGWDDLCPAGGDCYIVEDVDDPDNPYEVVCALHDKNTAQACRLNSGSAMEQLASQQNVRAVQENLTVVINSQEYTAVYDPSETVIEPTRRELRKAGGILLSYDVEDGNVIWLCYADVNHVRTWSTEDVGTIRSTDGWIMQ